MLGFDVEVWEGRGEVESLRKRISEEVVESGKERMGGMVVGGWVIMGLDGNVRKVGSVVMEMGVYGLMLE